MSGTSIEGEWSSSKDCCAFGYHGVWEIMVQGDEITVSEQHSTCCFVVPNCCRKRGRWAHRMVKVAENRWEGTLGCKKISIERVGDNELAHLTTDGFFTLTR